MKPKVLRRKNNKTFDNEKDAYNYALTLLNYRDYSIAEMQEKLRKCSVSDAYIKAVTDKLCGYGFLDEKRYALRVYDSWLAKKYYGKGYLKNTLQKRSVDDEIINEVAGLVEADAEIERCCAAADSYIKKKKAMKVKAGLGRFLFARGFSVDLIKKTIAEKISYSGVDNYD